MPGQSQMAEDRAQGIAPLNHSGGPNGRDLRAASLWQRILSRINILFRPLGQVTSAAVLFVAALVIAEIVALTIYVTLFSRSFGLLPMAITTALTTALVAAPLIFLFISTIKYLDRSRGRYREMRDRALAESQAKSKFLANMNHEFRTPLNAILGFCQVMQKRIHGPLGSERYAEYVEDIASSGMHLSALIDDVLEIARAETGLMPVDETAFRLSILVDELLTQTAHRARAKSILVEADLADDLPLLHADRRQVRRMLQHLLVNAIKFTPSGGWVVVSAYVAHEKDLVVSIADNGIGIPSNEIPMVLQPFYQVSQVENRAAGGAGLGLPLVKAMIECHGGAMTIESGNEQGTRVRLRFPHRRVRGAVASSFGSVAVLRSAGG